MIVSMGTLGRNIQNRLNEIGLTQKDLADKAGLSQVMVHKLISGKASSTSKIFEIAQVLGCDPEQLQKGVIGPPLKEGNVSNIGKYSNSMPLISWVQAGDWCDSPDAFAPGDAEDWLPRPNNAGSRSFALRVEGDSMTSPYPGQRSYPHGTIIFVDPDRAVTNGSRVVARTPDGHYTFKTYIEDAGKRYLKPINPTYDKFDITDDVHICGVVIGSYLPE